MIAVSASCLAIALASKSGSLRIEERDGRFGPFWTISDDRGLIEVADTADEARERVRSVEERVG